MSKKLLILFTFFIPINLYAHGDEKHEKEVVVPTVLVGSTHESINKKYLEKVKPIFMRSCRDCHSIYTVYPWYHKIPGVKQFLNHHIEEGREHLDISKDFPFKGHGNIVKDLKEIKEVLEKDEMPLFSYRLLHSEAKLTEEEKKTVYEWIDFALKELTK